MRLQRLGLSRVKRHLVVIDKSLAADVLAAAERCAPNETGGILLGYRDPGSRTVVISELVGAGPRARCRSNRFEPDGAWQRERVAERYASSGRTLAYIGDWHSHPLGGRPSGLDRATARRIAQAAAARCPHPIMLIAHCSQAEWTLCAFRYGLRRLNRVTVKVSER